MDRQQILALLSEHRPVLAQRFGVTRLALFGAQFYLEDLLGRSVDLVTETALRPQLKPYVERDAIAIA
jgi:predicted nucleotidyltransferase